MILVTLGTQDKSFIRLLKTIDDLIAKKIIKEEVIVQAGYTDYESPNMKIFKLLPKTEFIELINKSSFIITHAGVGSIFDGLKKGKKVIAVPRLAKYQEHTNDHQIEVAEELASKGYILSILEMKDLSSAIKNIEKFTPKPYKSNNKNMIKLIDDYIQNNNKRSLFKKKL